MRLRAVEFLRSRVDPAAVTGATSPDCDQNQYEREPLREMTHWSAPNGPPGSPAPGDERIAALRERQKLASAPSRLPLVVRSDSPAGSDNGRPQKRDRA